uniref:IGFBP-related protein 1 n=1 Tax=Asellus aquaticus TaxID=92525 RepID=A0A3G4TDZ8_ASEAQ|nr:IGFBP-related protein 1 [Asellus aquaticus]
MVYKVICILLNIILITYGLENDCEKCDRSVCPIVSSCVSGVTLDVCGCCEICAQKLGEKCDLVKEGEKSRKSCGDFLTCSPKGVCECEEKDAVCGSDGKTYATVCKLLEATAGDRELTLVERSPCRTGPVIKTAPKDSIRPLGSILVLDCEATGYPVATITWELNKDDGSTIQLPSDDSLVAIQMRGGPEKHMVTGWVQIMKILPENVGIYTCIATNDKGEARASAKVSFKEGNTAENEL